MGGTFISARGQVFKDRDCKCDLKRVDIYRKKVLKGFHFGNSLRKFEFFKFEVLFGNVRNGH